MANRVIIKVINKIDIIEGDGLADLRRNHPDFLFISAVTGEGVAELLNHLERGMTERA